jgi:SAM-dependent methyltransferase
MSAQPIEYIDERIVDIFFCHCCRHMQIPYILTPDYYDDYYYDSSFREKYFLIDRTRQINTLASLAPKDGLLIDIGCGTGKNLEIAREKFDNILGIEPSARKIEQLKKRGIPYIDGYFTREMMKDKRCSSFISTHVIDHIEHPLTILQDIFSVCYDGAVGIIEVTNGQLCWEGKDFPSIIAEHVNYFSPLSLSKLAYQAGFIVEGCNVILEGKNLEVLLRKPVPKDSFTNKRMCLIQKISEFPPDKIISIWGAGAKIFTYLRILERFLNIHSLYDSDPAKHGQYIPGCKTSISKPTFEDIQKNEIILLTNTNYDAEIVRILRETYCYKGDIDTL